MRLIAAALLTICVPDIAIGQRPAGLQPEVRAEFISGNPWSLLGGAGFNAPAGLYMRLGIGAAAGVARGGSSTFAVARVDGTARFLLDPFRQSRVGIYGLAGVSGMYLEREGWTPRVVLGLGLEGPARGRTITSVEFALGGGARLAVVLRRVRPRGR